MEHPKFDFHAGPHDARGVGFLLSELLERTRGLLAFPLRFRFGGGGGLRLFLSEFLCGRRLLGGLQRRRFARCSLFGQACVEINQ